MERLLNYLFQKKKETVSIPVEEKREPVLIVKLEDVPIEDGDKETIAAYIKSPAFEKTQKHLTCQLLTMMLQFNVAPEFKSGWLSCLRAMRDLPVDVIKPNEDEDYVYIDDADDL